MEHDPSVESHIQSIGLSEDNRKTAETILARCRLELSQSKTKFNYVSQQIKNIEREIDLLESILQTKTSGD